jgi:hypothetical protein
MTMLAHTRRKVAVKSTRSDLSFLATFDLAASSGSGDPYSPFTYLPKTSSGIG